MHRSAAGLTLAAVLLALTAGAAAANPRSDALRAEASHHTYNLDYEQAIALYGQAIAADPDDAAAYRGLATALWLSISLRRGTMTVDDYLGRITKPSAVPVPPPPDTAAAFNAAVERAMELARRRIAKDPRDADAHYQLGAAAYDGDNQDDARFALLLIYNREHRYDDALKTLSGLRERYPRNRLLWLETGATLVRAGRPADAERFLTDGLARLAGDRRPRMFGEEALWLYKRGLARSQQGRSAEAEADLRHALSVEGRHWVYGRTHLELGKLAAKQSEEAAARDEFQAAVNLCERDNDPGPAAEARRWLNTVR